MAWRHNGVAPTIASLFGPDSKREAGFETGMGTVDVPFDIANLRVENGEAAAMARLGWFPRRVQHPACLRDTVLRCRDGGGGGQGSEDYLLG